MSAVSQTPALDAFLVNTVRVAPHSRVVAVDGELVPMTPPLVYRFLPRHLRFVVGQGADAASTHGV